MPDDPMLSVVAADNHPEVKEGQYNFLFFLILLFIQT